MTGINEREIPLVARISFSRWSNPYSHVPEKEDNKGEKRKKFSFDEVLSYRLFVFLCVHKPQAPVAAKSENFDSFFWWIFLLVRSFCLWVNLMQNLGTTYIGDGRVFMIGVHKAFGHSLGFIGFLGITVSIIH